MTKQSNTPRQYLQGFVEFYKLKFKVTPDVLIPRPETELLVDEVLTHVRDCFPRIKSGVAMTSLRGASATKQSITILDLGTGAGNIAIALAKNLASHLTSGNVKIIATDISSKALKVAKQNAKLHEVLDNITFIQSDLLSVILEARSADRILEDAIASLQHDNFIIVTNLPYIPSERIPYLDSSVKDFEPLIALDGGEDGFNLYRKLFAQIERSSRSRTKGKNWKPKLIIGEIDYTQGELAVQEALNYFPDSSVEVRVDLAHKQRILRICETNRQGSRAKRGVLTD